MHEWFITQTTSDSWNAHARNGCARWAGVVFVVAEAKAKYKKPARLDDELVVRSTVTACGRTSFEFHQEILRGDEVLNVGDVRCGTLDAHTFRPVAMPEPISEQLKKLLTH